MMAKDKPSNLRNYVQRREGLRGIRKALFIARHPLLEAATKIGNTDHDNALRESEGKYTSIFQNNHTVMLLADLEKWSIADANPAACAFYGYQREELVGKSISDINPIGREELSRNLEEAMRKPRTKFYFSHQLADGRIRDVEVHTGPIVIDGKQLLYSIIHDVTEQKRIEGMIKKQGEFSTLRADIWSAVWSDRMLSEGDLIRNVMDCFDRFANMHSTSFFRIDRKTGDAVLEAGWGGDGITDPEAKKSIPKSILDLHRGKKAIDLLSDDISGSNCPNENEKGSKSCLLIPYGDENDPEGYFAFSEFSEKMAWERNDRKVFHEMVRILFARIEQINLEANIHQNEKLESLGMMAGGIAHDFNNMLTGICGYAELLKIKNEDSEVQEHAAIILSTAKRMAGLTQKLLTFARKGKYNVQTIDMRFTAEEVISVLEKGIENKNIRVVKRFLADCHYIEGDDSLVYNALLNLGLNARDAMPERGGEIAYETRNFFLKKSDKSMGLAAGDYLVLTVRDNGEGMDEETRKKAFEPFFTTKGIGKGTGLGLASVYRTVKSHHGHADIISIVGKGTAVELYLPISAKSSSRMDKEHAAPVRGYGTIMVVDDEPLVRETISSLLSASGYVPHQFCDGAEAIKFYEINWKGVDAVLLDMKMPGLDGRECFARMKRINPDVKAILVTGYSLDDEASAVMRDGMMGYITKPFSAEFLLMALNRGIGNGK